MEMVTRTQLSSPHGVKRHGDDSLESEQRLAKRFNLLNIGTSLLSFNPLSSAFLTLSTDRDSKLYIPVSAEHSTKAPRPSQPDDDFMQVDDTKDKVYIYDLDAELAESDPEDEQVIFIPEIERHLTKIPKHILTGQDEATKKENQLVLYRVPAALSVPEDKDSVRKAIIETRTRAQQKHEGFSPGSTTQRSAAISNNFLPDSNSRPKNEVMEEEDGDAMDLE